jgi:probable F420-dependent oxidoreductase
MDFGLHVGFNDHVITANAVDSKYPYSETGIWPAADTGTCLEQLMTIAFVAAVTEKIRLLTSVMVLPHRAPVLTAKMLATADVLSNGRLTVGVGIGWMAEEMAALQSPPYDQRAAASEDYVGAFKALWTQDVAAYDGDFIAFKNVLFDPKPVQRPHPPIWFGGEGKPARRRAGQLGDGWYPVIANPRLSFDTPAAYAKALDDVKRQAEDAGRDPATVDTALFVPWYSLGAAADADRRSFTGSAEQIADDARAFGDVGLKHLIIGFESKDLPETLDRIEAFADQVMPLAS